MVEYTLDEAIQLLEENRNGALKKLKETERTLEFVQDQVTIVQVSMARIHNWEVARKKAEAGRS